MKEIELHLKIKDKISGKSAAQAISAEGFPILTDGVGVISVKGEDNKKLLTKAIKSLMLVYFTASYTDFKNNESAVNDFTRLCKEFNL